MSSTPEPRRIPIVFANADDDVTGVVASAMTAARAAQSRWSRTPMPRRLQLVRELRHLIASHAMPLAEASAFARQRPALESMTAEVLPLAEACRFLERNTENILRTQHLGRRGLPLWLAGVRSEIQRVPLGVILIIGPGNYPLLLPGVQLIQALVAGNAVLLKPGVGGTAAAHALSELVTRAGFDAQLVAVLPESPATARATIFARPDKVIFTGSAMTGEQILTQLAPHLIPATMELSGNDAVLVRADADLDLAVKALTFGLTLNAGGTCMSPKRAFVHRSLATELEGRLADSLGTDRHAEVLTTAATTKLRPLLDDAFARGAHFITGEIRSDGTITAPIVLAGVSPASDLLREDIFAPVLSIVTVADDHEAVMRANDCPFALGAAIFTRDETTARSLASQIQAGVVTINDLIIPTADARVPFGGRKRSGYGVTRGAEGLLDMTTPKVVTLSRGQFRPALEPPLPSDEGMFQAYLQFAHGRGLKSRWSALATLIRSVACRKKSFRQ